MSTKPRSIASFGPLNVGQTFVGDWTINMLMASPEKLELSLSHGSSEEVVALFVQTTGHDGPFGVGPALTYRSHNVDLSMYHDAAMEIAAQFQSASAGKVVGDAVSQWLAAAQLQDEYVLTWAQIHGASKTWQDVARDQLVDQPDRTLKIVDLLPAELVPDTPCLLPWLRLEFNPSGVVGPCCMGYQAKPTYFDRKISIGEVWNSDAMRKFRSALASGDPLQTCSAECPHLAGRTSDASAESVVGGTLQEVNVQLSRVEALVNKSDYVEVSPARVQFSPTEYCNYDCLMCYCGEFGTLDDSSSEAFYTDLNGCADALQSIDVTGGEPFASPLFRDFVLGFGTSRFASLGLSVVTNGSYFTPSIIDALCDVKRCNLIVSLNACSDETYLVVNQGLPYQRVRKQLDYLIAKRAVGRFRGLICYSMVLLLANVHEIEAFAALCRADGVEYRFKLPHFNRNNQSIMLDPDVMRTALESLERVADADRELYSEERFFRLLEGVIRVLRTRLADGIVGTLPDDKPRPEDSRSSLGLRIIQKFTKGLMN